MALNVLARNSSDACFVSVRITNDDREDEMEENLSHVVNHVEMLKNMALDFSNKIEDQIQIIDHVNNEVQLLLSYFTEVKCICDSRDLDLQ